MDDSILFFYNCIADIIDTMSLHTTRRHWPSWLANIRRKNNDGKSYIDNLPNAFKEVLKVNQVQLVYCAFTSHQLPKKQNKKKIFEKREWIRRIIKYSIQNISSGCSPQKLDLKPSRRIVLSSNEKKANKIFYFCFYTSNL